jgi:hypothetical protein
LRLIKRGKDRAPSGNLLKDRTAFPLTYGPILPIFYPPAAAGPF